MTEREQPIMNWFHRALLVTAMVVAMIPPGVRGQDRSMNSCIDGCFSSCSAYPLGSSSKQACIDRCLQSTCKAKSVNVWGAIAYSWREQDAGWSFEQSDQKTAENVALQNCKKQGGARCEMITSFSKTCASLAADGNLIGFSSAGNKAAAQQQALAQCAKAGGKNCSIQAWTCSAPSSDGGAAKPSAPAAPKNPSAAAWGAIAYSSRDMGAGWSQGKEDKASAEREAIAKCAQRGKDCVIRAAFNKQCGGLAADGPAVGVGISADQKQALD
jgi:hypothetical protein